MDERELLAARLKDLAKRGRRRGSVVCTAFLSEGEQALALSICRKERLPEPEFFGGYEEAERKMAFFPPEGGLEDVFSDNPPIAAFSVSAGEEGLEHRDYLGALLGLGVKREMIGDIFADHKTGLFFAAVSVADLIERELNKVGRVAVRVRRISLSQARPPEKSSEELCFTVSSLRMDSVCAGVFRRSRSEAAERIEAGLAKKNDLLCDKVDRPVVAGDKLSIRGWGKGEILDTSGLSKKGRIFVKALRYR